MVDALHSFPALTGWVGLEAPSDHAATSFSNISEDPESMSLGYRNKDIYWNAVSMRSSPIFFCFLHPFLLVFSKFVFIFPLFLPSLLPFPITCNPSYFLYIRSNLFLIFHSLSALSLWRLLFFIFIFFCVRSRLSPMPFPSLYSPLILPSSVSSCFCSMCSHLFLALPFLSVLSS